MSLLALIKTSVFVGALFTGLSPATGSAASLTASLDLSATLEAACKADVNAPLNMSGFETDAGSVGQTTFSLVCSQIPSAGVSLNFGGGQNWQNGQRYMLGAIGNYRLAYQLSIDTQNLTPDIDIPVTQGADGTYRAAVRASIPIDQNALPDFYSDSVTVTFKF